MTPTHLKLARTCVSVLLLCASRAAANPPPLTVSSPLACRSDVDCKPGNFCLLRGPVGLCRPKLAEGAPCTGSSGVAEPCQSGLHCGFVGFTDPSNRCVRQSGPGRFCSPRNPTACKPPLICADTLCRLPRTAPLGGTCVVDVDCKAAKSFCADNGRCARKRAAGETCEVRSAAECLGFCQSFSPAGARCVAAARVNRLCFTDSECAGGALPTPRGGRVVCNRFERNRRQDYGRCVPYARLRLRLGAPCHPWRNPCDYERGLVCRWAAGQRRHVCHHWTTHATPESNRFCAPGSPLSRCPDADFECRPPRIDQTDDAPFAKCRPRRRFRAPGTRCDDEPVRCTQGSVCRAVRGVAGDTPTKYCVLPRGAGGSCANKFRAQCRDGLKCVSGTCRVAGADTDAVTHGGLGARCDGRPCAPGLRCTDARTCAVRIERGGPRDWCGFTVIDELGCKTGLTCRRDDNGWGPLRCRAPQPVGGACDFGACAGGLQCLRTGTSDGKLPPGFCYDPRATLALGSRCDPMRQRDGPTCAPFEPGQARAVRCLAKGGAFSCQVAVGLFQKCNTAKNVVCADSRLRCSALGICVQK